MTSAGGVTDAWLASQRAGGGATPTSALQALRVAPVTHRVAKELLRQGHYLGTLPAGTRLSFGVFAGQSLTGVVTLGVGPPNGHRLIHGAGPDECLTMTRFLLSDRLPRNSESRVLSVVLRALRRNTSVRFVLTYADPAVGHTGVIYRAAGFLYLGLSQGVARYDIGDGRRHHSRTFSHVFGTRSRRHLEERGLTVRLVDQAPKHRYLYLLDASLQERIAVPRLQFPKTGECDGSP